MIWLCIIQDHLGTIHEVEVEAPTGDAARQRLAEELPNAQLVRIRRAIWGAA